MSSLQEWTLTEFKKELLRLTTKIAGEDDFGKEDVENAIKILEKFLARKLKASSSSGSSVPSLFKCPISHQIFQNPVILTSGYTYDRDSISDLLKNGAILCPLSQEDISTSLQIPNRILMQLIYSWCLENEVEFPSPWQLASQRLELNSVLEKLSSSSLLDQKSGAKDLRNLTDRIKPFDSLMKESDLEKILLPLTAIDLKTADLETGIDLLVCLHNMLLSTKSCRKSMGEHPIVIPLLIRLLNLKMLPMEAKVHAAECVFLMWELDSNKDRINEAGWTKVLLRLVSHETSHQKQMKDEIYSLFCGTDGANQVAVAVAEILGEDLKKVERMNMALDSLKNTKISMAQQCALRMIHSLLTLQPPHPKQRCWIKEINDDEEAVRAILAFALYGEHDGEIPQAAANHANQILKLLGLDLQIWEAFTNMK